MFVVCVFGGVCLVVCLVVCVFGGVCGVCVWWCVFGVCLVVCVVVVVVCIVQVRKVRTPPDYQIN